MSPVPLFSPCESFLQHTFPLSKGENYAPFIIFPTSISFALHKLGTQHNSPPVSKCKRVNSQELIQTGMNYASLRQGQVPLAGRRWDSPSATGQQPFPYGQRWLLEVRLGISVAPRGKAGQEATALGQIPKRWM